MSSPSRSKWVAIALVAIAGSIVFARSRRAAPAIRAELAFDASAIVYRFPIAGDTAAARDATIRTLETRIASSPSPFEMAELADLYLRRAQEAGDPRDYTAAEATAQRSLAILRWPNPALLVAAKLANARHDFRGAIALADETLAHKRSSGAEIVRATAYLALGDTAAAARAAGAALAIRPDAAGHQMRALAAQAAGHDAEATRAFAAAAVAEDYGSPSEAARTRALWGRFLLRRGELAGAATLLAEAARIAPASPLVLGLRGELALRSGDTRGATELFEQAFALGRQTRYLIDQARARELDDDREGAEALRAHAEGLVRADLRTGGLGHRLELVEVLVDRGANLADAVGLARDEATARPSAEARYQLARALARSGRVADALAEARAVLATGAREAQYCELAARLERAAGDADLADAAARCADELDPTDAGWRRLGMP